MKYERTTPVEIRRVGTLRSCQKWYAFATAEPGSGPVAGSGHRTRREARAWCEAHGYDWKAQR